MKRKMIGRIILALLLVAVISWLGFTAEVREGEVAVITRFGAVRESVDEAGLYFRLPWPFENVKKYDSRAQYLESGNIETLMGDQRNIILQSYAVWQIEDTVLYHKSVGELSTAESYIGKLIFSATNAVAGGYKLTDIVSTEEGAAKLDKLEADIEARVAEECRRSYGIGISEIAILRVSLPDANLQSVFDQMMADRQKVIDNISAEAERDAQKIIADADAEAAKILAEGKNQASEINKLTELEVAKIYADAQAANLELYTFLSQLDTLYAAVGENTTLIVKTDDYPFNALKDLAGKLTGDETDAEIINELETLLGSLSETDRIALLDALKLLIAEAGKTA